MALDQMHGKNNKNSRSHQGFSCNSHKFMEKESVKKTKHFAAVGATSMPLVSTLPHREKKEPES
jgi:hypothetical protein